MPGAGLGLQRVEAEGLVFQRLAHGRVLLGLDHQPAAVAGLRHHFQHSVEVHRALFVAGYGEYPAAHALDERQVLVPHLRHDLGADVLGVQMAEPVHVARQHRGRIAAAKVAMAGVEQQLGRRCGVLHQQGVFLRRLHHRAHVRVVDEVQPAGFDVLGDGFNLRPELRPLRVRQNRALAQRDVLRAVDGVGGLGGNAHLAAHGDKSLEVRLDIGDLLFHAALEQLQAVPGGDESEAVGRQHGFQFGRILRVAVAVFDSAFFFLYWVGRASCRRLSIRLNVQ